MKYKVRFMIFAWETEIRSKEELENLRYNWGNTHYIIIDEDLGEIWVFPKAIKVGTWKTGFKVLPEGVLNEIFRLFMHYLARYISTIDRVKIITSMIRDIENDIKKSVYIPDGLLELLEILKNYQLRKIEGKNYEL